MSQGSDDDTSTREDGAKDELFGAKKTSTSIRVLTVLAYVLSVSLAAIMLSLYYVFLWDPKVPHIMGRVSELAGAPPCQSDKPEHHAQMQSYPSTPPIIQYLMQTSPSPYMATTTHNSTK